MDRLDKQDLIESLKETLDKIETQIDVLEHLAFHRTHGSAHELQLADGSWPMIPLLVAKAQTLNALAHLVTA